MGLPASGRLDRARTWLVLAIVAAAVGAYYLWVLRAAGYRFDWKNSNGGYYNYLARAFAHGHLEIPIQPAPALLAQPNPWDPAVDDSLKMHDMALFRGRYYLYHGAAPAVLLFTPWLLITGHDLPERFALFVFCFGGFLFSCGVLIRWLALGGVRVGLPLLACMLLALGLCQAVPYLLCRVWVYEIAIGGGYFSISAALFFLTMGVESRRGYWLGASGLMFGLAIACRPHFGLGGLCVLAALALLPGGWRSRQSGVIAFAAAFAIISAGVAAYNFQRFGDPLEFGVRYLLAGPNQNRIRLARENILPGLYFWLACPPDVSGVFPWLRLAFRYPFNSLAWSFPQGYFIERTVGAFFLAPFVAGALLLPFARRVKKDLTDGMSMVRILSFTVLVFSAAVLLFLAATGFTTQRYTVDFLPALVLVAIAQFALRIGRSRGRSRFVPAAVLVFSIAWGVLANMALAMSGPFDEILKNRPASYLRIARWFSPSDRNRPRLNPDIRISFTTVLTPGSDHKSEPLVTMGHQAYRYFLYAESSGSNLQLVSRTEASSVIRPLGPYQGFVNVEIIFAQKTRKLTVVLNGQEVIDHEIGPLVTAPAQITVGENRIDMGVTSSRYTGKIFEVTTTVTGG